jgi:hypothetical protein
MSIHDKPLWIEIMKLSLAALALIGFSTAAMAADMSGATNQQLAGKRLLDANGAPIGQITGVVDNGDKAAVRTPDGRTITIATSRLSPGDGQNTVIASGQSEADALNRIDRHMPIADGE